MIYSQWGFSWEKSVQGIKDSQKPTVSNELEGFYCEGSSYACTKSLTWMGVELHTMRVKKSCFKAFSWLYRINDSILSLTHQNILSSMVEETWTQDKLIERGHYRLVTELLSCLQLYCGSTSTESLAALRDFILRFFHSVSLTHLRILSSYIAHDGRNMTPG